MASAAYMIIREAVLKRLTIQARYAGYERVFCPHAIGMKRGEEHVLGYQYAGSSSSGLPTDGEWRCFVVRRLQGVTIITGPWRTGHTRTRTSTCIDRIDVEVL